MRGGGGSRIGGGVTGPPPPPPPASLGKGGGLPPTPNGSGRVNNMGKISASPPSLLGVSFPSPQRTVLCAAVHDGLVPLEQEGGKVPLVLQRPLRRTARHRCQPPQGGGRANTHPRGGDSGRPKTGGIEPNLSAPHPFATSQSPALIKEIKLTCLINPPGGGGRLFYQQKKCLVHYL